MVALRGRVWIDFSLFNPNQRKMYVCSATFSCSIELFKQWFTLADFFPQTGIFAGFSLHVINFAVLQPLMNSAAFSYGVALKFLSREIYMTQGPHCKEIWIYIFPEKELRGLSPNFYIHVSVSDLYNPTFGPPTDQRNINHSQKHECRN